MGLACRCLWGSVYPLWSARGTGSRSNERITMHKIKRTAVGLVGALALTGAAAAVTAPAAMAGQPYCNSSTCSLSGAPNSGPIFYEMPRYTPVTMVCWTDAQWWRGTNRWFRVQTKYGNGWMIATQVSSQVSTPHC